MIMSKLFTWVLIDRYINVKKKRKYRYYIKLVLTYA